MGRPRWRLRVTAGCAALSWVLFAVTLAVPDWIEAVLRVNPDQGSGSLEWAIAGVLFAAAVGLSGITRREWRRLQPGGVG
ncbi:MAG: transporter permease [Actinomycetia bacterium]|nr:transporter permease [Actinomycetes bacterium]